MSPQLKITVAAIGWTGHAFPAFALATELDRRGHEVTVESFERWRATAVDLGLGFRACVESIDFAGLGDDPAAPTLAGVARELSREFDADRPDAVVSDLFTLAPALAAELAGIPRASLIPHPYPAHEPGLPFYPLGLRPPRTPAGALAWRALWPLLGTRLPNTRLGRIKAALNSTRAELGLAPQLRHDGQISDQLAMVATFPELEYERRWPRHVHVTGPMPFELPHPDIELPRGDDPLVLVASSTERDPEMRLLRTAIEALAGEPVRVVAAVNRRGFTWPEPVPANTVVVDWLSYRQLMPAASLVICHGGHGTVARALSAGVPLLICPPAGDMAENGARVQWSGAGLKLPDALLGRRTIRSLARKLLAVHSYRNRAAEIAAAGRSRDGAAIGADLVEQLAGEPASSGAAAT